MIKIMSAVITAMLISFSYTVSAQAEILAMANYESKTPESLKSLKLSGPQEREEGIAIFDVDPKSETFGDILMTIPLPSDLVAHHIFYDRTMTKAYITALGKGELRVMDMTQSPYRMKVIDVPQCQVGEDVIFNEDNTVWYLTCMGSGNVVVGDVKTDEIKTTIDIPGTYPHGLAVHTGIDRILVTNTITPDLSAPQDTLTVIEASTNKVIGSINMTDKEELPAGEGPVEILLAPHSNPPVFYVTNMTGGSLWTATWNEKKKDFDVSEVYNFAAMEKGFPLEIYFNAAGDRLYVTVAQPGEFYIFDTSENIAKPKFVKMLPTGEGAHHVALTKDGQYAFVQNALLNLPGMSDGSITVIDLKKQEVVASVDTFKDMGLNPNCIVLLPEWNDFGWH